MSRYRQVSGRTRICIDARKFRDTGIGRTLTSTLSTIIRADRSRSYVLLMPRGDPVPIDLQEEPHVTIAYSETKNYSLGELLFLPFRIASLRPQLLHEPHYTVPVVNFGWRTVVTIHDLTHLRFGGYANAPVRKAYVHAMMRLAADSDRIIVPSLHTKDDLINLIGAKEERIRVIPWSADPVFRPSPDRSARAFARQLGLPESFLLYVGMWKYHKNLSGLLRAIAILKARGTWEGRLCIVGKPDPVSAASVTAQISELGLESSVVMTGYLSDERLRDLYSTASAVIQPSFYEGWGLTVMEAMACGAPVVCSNAASLPEVAGKAALMFDPHATGDLVDAITRVITDTSLAKRLSAAGLRRAAGFSWEKTAAGILAVYDELLPAGQSDGPA